MISTILVATDGSEAAGNAERFGVALASRMKGRLLGISVVEDRFTRGTPKGLEATLRIEEAQAGKAAEDPVERLTHPLPHPALVP